MDDETFKLAQHHARPDGQNKHIDRQNLMRSLWNIAEPSQSSLRPPRSYREDTAPRRINRVRVVDS